mmetsp:Transcript_41152/g.97680  ORF Transcript_41152/g.97680 Transcript_41152/m.97680 type:complete len:208 (+) Transcript_41152:1983-2606(+)
MQQQTRPSSSPAAVPPCSNAQRRFRRRRRGGLNLCSLWGQTTRCLSGARRALGERQRLAASRTRCPSAECRRSQRRRTRGALEQSGRPPDQEEEGGQTAAAPRSLLSFQALHYWMQQTLPLGSAGGLPPRPLRPRPCCMQSPKEETTVLSGLPWPSCVLAHALSHIRSRSPRMRGPQLWLRCAIPAPRQRWGLGWAGRSSYVGLLHG